MKEPQESREKRIRMIQKAGMKSVNELIPLKRLVISFREVIFSGQACRRLEHFEGIYYSIFLVYPAHDDEK